MGNNVTATEASFIAVVPTDQHFTTSPFSPPVRQSSIAQLRLQRWTGNRKTDGSPLSTLEKKSNRSASGSVPPSQTQLPDTLLRQTPGSQRDLHAGKVLSSTEQGSGDT